MTDPAARYAAIEDRLTGLAIERAEEVDALRPAAVARLAAAEVDAVARLEVLAGDAITTALTGLG